MSRRHGGGGGGGGGGQKLDLKLHLSPPRGGHRAVMESSNQSTMMSPTSSCLSSELIVSDEIGLQYSTSPEATSMMLVGCPRCLMYIMLAEEYPKCPRCKSTVLLDVVHNNVKKSKK